MTVIVSNKLVLESMDMNFFSRLIFIYFSVWIWTIPATADAARIATEWNASVLEIAEAEDHFLTLKGLRTVALMHLAMHDALNGDDGRYERYLSTEIPSGEKGVAAAVHAAHHVAVHYFPDQHARLERLRDDHLRQNSSHVDHDDARAYGQAVAAAVIDARTKDGWDREAEYQWHPMAPGVYAQFNEHSGTPEGFVFGAGWAQARGFGFDQADVFRVPPPPPIKSEAYTRAFNEVKSLGRFQSLQRTPDQTHLALWWKDFVENSHNRLARDLIAKEKTDLVDAVRLLALLNMGVFDAYVTSFNNKFHYNHWRPYTAIRWADQDGNDATELEHTWTNTHRHTYAFPSYPSAHGTACAAAMTALATVYGADYAFTMRTPLVDIAGPLSEKIEMQPATRSFKRFSEAAAECGESRVYLGIHFRYDAEAGVALGQRVGNNLRDRLLRPLRR